MSALPKSLCSTYLRYKEDNSKLATWLVENVQLCGHKLCPPTHPLKLKGRERTLARRVQKQSTTKPGVARISADDFQKFAAIIAKSKKPKIEVPQALISLLRRLISARRKCNAWYEANAPSAKTASSNNTHWYFIGILERVLDLLSPLSHLKPQPSPNEHNGVTPAPDNRRPLSNRFEELGLQDQTRRDTRSAHMDDGEIGEIIEASASESTDEFNATVEVEALPNQEDIGFGCLCVLNDLQDIRANLRDLWLRYKNLKVPLITACLKTDAAFRLVRDIENEFAKQFGQGCSYAKIFRDVFFKSTCSSDQLFPSDGFNVKGQYGSLLNPSNIRASEQCFLPEWCILNDFRSVTCCSDDEYQEIKKDLPRLKPDMFGDFKDIGEAQFWIQTILIVQHLRGVSWYLDSDPTAQDQFCAAFVEVAEDGEDVPLWMAFCSRIYVDINQTLGRADMTRPLQELDGVALHVKTVVKKYLDFLEELDEPAVENGFPRSLRSLVERSDLVLDDRKSNVRARCAFSSLPVNTGLVAFRLLHALHRESLYFTDYLQAVLPAAHLCNALTQERVMDTTWADMDELLRYHGRQHVFVGEPPKTVPKYWRHLALATGASLTNFCRRTRNKKFKERTQGIRQLSTGHTHLTRVTMKQMENITGPPESMEGLALLAWTITEVPKGRKKIEQDWKGQVQNMPDLWKAARGLARTPPGNVLDMLERALEEEVPYHYYDYFGVNERSWHLLRTVIKELGEHGFLNVQGHAITEYEALTPELLFWLDWNSSDLTGQEFRTKSSTRIVEGSSCDILAAVGDCVSKYLSEHGSIAVDYMQKQMMPRLAKVLSQDEADLDGSIPDSD